MVEVLGKPVPEDLLDHLAFMHHHNAEDIFRVFPSERGTVMTRSYKDGFYVIAFAEPQGDGSWKCRSHWVSVAAVADLLTSVPEAYRYLEPLFKPKKD